MQLATVPTTPSVLPVATPQPAPPMPWAKAYVDNVGDISFYNSFARSYAYADRVIGSEFGYATLEDAKAAVAELRPLENPAETDVAKMQPAVAYVDNGFDAVAALELDTSLSKVSGLFEEQLVVPGAYSLVPGGPNIVAVQNFRGDFLENLGVDNRH